MKKKKKIVMMMMIIIIQNLVGKYYTWSKIVCTTRGAGLPMDHSILITCLLLFSDAVRSLQCTMLNAGVRKEKSMGKLQVTEFSF
jgi:hypothetical protein